MNQTFLKAVPILTKIEEAGFEAYFVGGSVRDYLLDKEINDVDIATSATPSEIKSVFGKTVDVGIEHGTVLVIHDGEGYEITTFRTETGYSDFRRPDTVQFIRTLEEDLKRRDFTMNAIAMNKAGDLIDPFHGKKDILEKRIITVGNPDERFREDALRMMRAIRFVSQLTFELDGQTLESLQKNGYLLENIAVERIFAEFEKMLKGEGRKKAFELLNASGLYTYLPGFSNQGKTLDALQALPLQKTDDPAELWSLFMILCQIDHIESLLRDWKMPIKQIREIQSISHHVSAGTDFTNDRLALLTTGMKDAVKAVRVMAVLEDKDERDSERRIVEVFKRLPIHDMSELTVNGNDLVTWYGRRPGPWIKEELQFILKSILNGETVNRKEAIKEWLMFCDRM
ncbi:CCA tRNA nucleotidyltransferase [Bacillus sp. V59.32b]|uniref:CCA tRNA nucleotidyltransferase n=1 Tax=Bacillus sp. V59.32b TaxID=1758642 RepID=UPI000E3E478E|nr:CCA tRNA nucleotidyltransferase [Bacillus sp. V59.32b]RFU69113.1 CCA tRNA nucleotidyltransferase [Bacillus sp. V59.32b]